MRHSVKTNARVLFYCNGAKHSVSLRNDRIRHTTKRVINQTGGTKHFFSRGLIPGSEEAYWWVKEPRVYLDYV